MRPRFAVALAVTLVACATGAPQPAPQATASSAPAASSAPLAKTIDVGSVVTRDASADASVAITSAPDASAPDASALDAATATAAAPEGMLLVPAGTFTMGADEGGEEDERPAHKVTLAAFWLDKTEVTQKAYAECVAKKACREPDYGQLAQYGSRFRGPNKPVVTVSWSDSRAYCTFLGRRLPREAEFERAVRGDDSRPFPWGTEAPTKERSVFGQSSPEDVGSRPAGRGPYGHDDLAGNVWEWMEDEYDPIAYRRAGAANGAPGSCNEILAVQDKLRREGKQGFTGSNPIPSECERAIRGGAYNYDAFGLRSTNRVHHPGSFRLRMTGFRCAKDAAP